MGTCVWYRVKCGVASEVPTAADLLIQNSPGLLGGATAGPPCAKNKYSLLSRIITTRGNEHLKFTQKAVGTVDGLDVACLLYDGCAVRYKTHEELGELRGVIEAIHR